MSSMPSKVEECFLCPITCEIMKEPMLAPTGVSYEKEAITEWIVKNGTDPVSRKPLKVEDLVPNHSLRSAIEALGTTTSAGCKSDAEEKISNSGQDKLKKVPIHDPSSLLTLSAQASTPNENGETYVHVKVNVSKEARPKPLDLVLCLDISGSMSSIQQVQNENGEKESHGLTSLDVVKHACNTIIQSLTPQDRVCLIVFSNDARTILKFQPMTKDYKTAAILALKLQNPTSATNMWAGIQKSMQELQESSRPEALKKIFLLTDGVPTYGPPRGYGPAMEKFKKSFDIDFTMSTFGFGYNLKSDLLLELATICDGTYAFIPDAGMVGTNFVNSVATIRSVYRSNAALTIQSKNGTKIAQEKINLSDIYVGRSRDAMVTIKLPEDWKERNVKLLDLTLTLNGKKEKSCSLFSDKVGKLSAKAQNAMMNERNRHMYLDVLQKIWQADVFDSLRNSLHVKQFTKQASNESSAYTKALIKECEGEIKLGCFDGKNWHRWGRHYIRSLYRNHQLQVCSNFKDIALQFYTSDIFEKLRDEGDEIFLKLPPPTPSAPTKSYNSMHCGGQVRRKSSSKPLSMANYYSQSRGCFAEFCTTTTPDGEKRLDSLKKGDKVLSGKGTWETIKCIVRNRIPEEKAAVIRIGERLVSTPFHPIKQNGRWVFPIDVGVKESISLDYVYSFLLESGTSMMIEGIECITYAHNIKGDPVASHDFFGTKKVVLALEKMKGYDHGMVDIVGVFRNPSTGLVESFQQ